MRQAVIDTAAQLRQHPPAAPTEDLAEDLAFLEWLADDNFTLLGQRDYDLVAVEGEDTPCSASLSSACMRARRAVL